MSSLFPRDTDEEWAPSEEVRVVGLDDECGDVFETLSNDTRRELLRALYESPRTETELAETLDTSVQNVDYHLGILEEADLVEVSSVRYSEKRREMDVYAPAVESLAIVVSDDETTSSSIRDTLARLVGGLAVVGLASLAVDELFARVVSPRPTASALALDSGGSVTATPTLFLSPGGALFLVAATALCTLALWRHRDGLADRLPER